MSVNERFAVVIATILAVLWTVLMLAVWLSGARFVLAALLATGIVVGGCALGAAVIAGLNWAMRGSR